MPFCNYRYVGPIPGLLTLYRLRHLEVLATTLTTIGDELDGAASSSSQHERSPLRDGTHAVQDEQNTRGGKSAAQHISSTE
jgi:hypothetical protein